MSEEINYDFGVDIKNDWNFENGDLAIAKYNDNIVQVCKNILTTELNELELFYENYGSLLVYFLGWKRTNETLSIIKTEIETSLHSDPRLQDIEVVPSYNQLGGLDIKIVIYSNGIITNVNLVYDNNYNLVEEGLMEDENGS